MGVLGKFKRRLQALEKKVARPVAFYALHRAEWLELAQEYTHDFLVNTRPGDMEDAQWSAAIADTVSRITLTLVEEASSTGAVLCIEENSGDEYGPIIEQPLGEITFEQVKRWVAAGRAKNSEMEPGKNLTQIDAGMTDDEIAWRVMKVIRMQGNNWERLSEAVKGYLETEAIAAVDDVSGGLLAGWLELFSMRAGADWVKWVTQQIAEA